MMFLKGIFLEFVRDGEIKTEPKCVFYLYFLLEFCVLCLDFDLLVSVDNGLLYFLKFYSESRFSHLPSELFSSKSITYSKSAFLLFYLYYDYVAYCYYFIYCSLFLNLAHIFMDYWFINNVYFY